MSVPEPRWLGRLAIDEAHHRQIREHGGAHGIRDENAIESALARARDRWAYDPDATLADLAAAYAFGLARNHGYVDGNKRVALVAMAAFPDRNGWELAATNADALRRTLEVAAGRLTETRLAHWIERNLRSVRPE